jgi:hypothetical protein
MIPGKDGLPWPGGRNGSKVAVPHRGSDMVWFWSVLGIGVLAIAAIMVLLYSPYRRSPEKLWRDRVRRLVAAARHQLWMDQEELRALEAHREGLAKDLHHKAFVSYLDSIPVEQLDDYQNIGPVTVAKVREAGYTTLASLQNVPVNIPGLGQKRLGDVKAAVRDLTKNAKTRFETVEAQHLRETVGALTGEIEERDFRARARIRSVQTLLTRMEETITVARRVTFRQYLGKEWGFLIPAHVRNRALPELERLVADADRQAALDYAGRKVPVPTPPPVAVPVAVLVSESASKATPAPSRSADPFGLTPAANAPPGEAKKPSAKKTKPAPPAAEQVLAKPIETPGPKRPTPRQDQLAALEIDPALPLSAELIRRQYNRLRERYTPDKVAAMGPEFVAMARSKHAAIEAAATALMEPFGEKLEPVSPPSGPQPLRDNPDLDAVFGV